MKVYAVQNAVMDICLQEAQKEGVVITRNGSPVAVMLGVEGLDMEQIELCQSTSFWDMIRQRRSQKTISRQQLEERLAQK